MYMIRNPWSVVPECISRISAMVSFPGVHLWQPLFISRRILGWWVFLCLAYYLCRRNAMPLLHKTVRRVQHDDVITRKHCPRYWPFCVAFTGHCWITLTKAREAGDLRRHRAHYDVMVTNCRIVHWQLWSLQRIETDTMNTILVVLVQGAS